MQDSVTVYVPGSGKIYFIAPESKAPVNILVKAFGEGYLEFVMDDTRIEIGRAHV